MSLHPTIAKFGVSCHDWPGDFAHENGNYSCECTQCGCGFVGHKRRLVCRQCDQEAKEKYSAMSEKERAKFLEEREARMLAWMAEHADEVPAYTDES